MNEKSREINNSQNKAIIGTVTARKCECCDHHEIGVITHTGEYFPLKPGMKVEIIGGDSD